MIFCFMFLSFTAFPEVSTDRELSLGLHTEDEGQYLTPEPSENGK
jgi:hypothetical protein